MCVCVHSIRIQAIICLIIDERSVQVSGDVAEYNRTAVHIHISAEHNQRHGRIDCSNNCCSQKGINHLIFQMFSSTKVIMEILKLDCFVCKTESND